MIPSADVLSSAVAKMRDEHDATMAKAKSKALSPTGIARRQAKGVASRGSGHRAFVEGAYTNHARGGVDRSVEVRER